MTTQIAMIGLGIMGRPMAANLVAAGHTVRGHVRSSASRSAAEAVGVAAIDTIASAVDGAEVVITMLPDSPDVLAVCETDILPAIGTGALYIDMSTIEPAVARDLHPRFAERGVGAVDAPVSGGEQAAIDGMLSIMVGGEAADVERARAVLTAVGSTIVHVGSAGSGQTVKAANQLMVAAHLQALAEAVLFLRRSGTDPASALAVIGAGLAGSTVLERKGASMLAGRFEPGFRLALHHKDLGIVQRSARELGLALPATALVAQLVQSAVARGDGALDHSALLKLLGELNAPGDPHLDPLSDGDLGQ